jgi:hypothetical protein
LELDANKNKQLDIEVSVPKSAVKVDARLKGTLSFTSESKKDSTQRAQFDKPFTASVTPIFDRSVDKRRAAILIAGALLLALLVLYVLNLLSSKLELGTVAVATIPVRFDGRQFLRIDDGVTSPLEVRPADLDGMNVPPEGSHRRVNVGQVEFSSHVSASPFSPVSGRARRSDAHFNVSNRGSTRKGRVGTLDAALKDAWLFSSESYPLVDDTGIKPLDGTLTILVPPDLDEARSHLEHLRPDIEQMVERRCEEHKVEPPTVVPTDPGRDDPGGTPESTRPPSWDWATDDRPPMDVPVTDPFGGTTLGSAPPGPDEKTPRRFGRTRQE